MTVSSRSMTSLSTLYRQLLIRAKAFIDPQASTRLLQLIALSRASARDTCVTADRLKGWHGRLQSHLRQLDRAAALDPRALAGVLERAYGQRGRLRHVYLSAFLPAREDNTAPELIPGVARSRPPQTPPALHALLQLQFPTTIQPVLPIPAGASARLQRKRARSSARAALNAHKRSNAQADPATRRALQDQVERSKNNTARSSATPASVTAALRALMPPLNKRREANFLWRHQSRLLAKTAVPIPKEDLAWMQRVAARQVSLLQGQGKHGVVAHGLRLPIWRYDSRRQAADRHASLCNGTASSMLEKDALLPGLNRPSRPRKARAVAAHGPTDRFFARLYARLLVKVPILTQSPEDLSAWRANFASTMDKPPGTLSEHLFAPE